MQTFFPISIATLCLLCSFSSAIVPTAQPASPSLASQLNANDIKVLNMAYSVESLAVEFGREALTRLAADSSAPLEMLQMMNESTQRHEVHQSTVASLLQARNVTAAAACRLRPALLSSTSEIARLNQELMYTAVGAYTGSTQLIASADLLAQMSRIMTVDARIAAEANRSAGLPAVPAALDVVLTPAEVLARAATLADCSALDLPVPLEQLVPGGVINATAANPAAAAALALNDLRALQLSYLLENLAFLVDSSDVMVSNLSQNAQLLFNNSAAIHNEHRAALLAAIQERNATAVPGNCTVNPSLASNATEALRRQQELLYTAVGAYNGASTAISNLTLLLQSARIATVDARLAAEANMTQGLSPFPTPLDVSLTPAEVFARLQTLGVSCPSLVFAQPISAVLAGLTNSPTQTGTQTQTQTQTGTQTQTQTQTGTQTQTQSQQPRSTNPSLTLPSSAAQLSAASLVVLLLLGVSLLFA